ncbi:MAG: YjbH domain-containing protein [Porticoccaceae bacterium]|nr:YjbH domain-containing protein [Porticoccaceae bacterium]
MLKKISIFSSRQAFFQAAIINSVISLFFINQTTANERLMINDLNYLGTSGLFFVPTGTTLDYGEFNFLHSNMVDHAGYRRQVSEGDSPFKGNAYSFALSPFPGVEIGMSNMGYDLDLSSDLIANVKYSPTFIPDSWFDLSIGAIDLGGETGAQRALYGSVSKQLGQVRLTLGSGVQKQEQTLRRYEGGFGGIEYQPYPWLTAIAEHDGANNHYGVKVRTPSHWLGGHTQIYSSALLNSNIDDKKETTYFSVGVRTSLYSSTNFSLESAKPLEKSIANRLPWLFSDSPGEYKTIVKRLPTQIESKDDWLVDRLGRLKRVLTKQGFESVWVGKDNQRLVIRFENSVFNRNDIDALGVVMGLATKYMPEETSVLDITLSKYGVPTFRFETSLSALKAFFTEEGAFPVLTSRKPKDQQIHKMLWVGGSASPFGVPRISLSPAYQSFAGTELGVFDYSLALRSSVEIPLWPGATLLGDYDHQLKQSEDFERGRTFYRWSLPSRWTNVALTQAFQLPLNIYSSVGFGHFKGTYQQEFKGIFGELTWQSRKGAHRFSLSGGYYESTVFDELTREVGVGKYRYYFDDLDLMINIEAGQFWYQDRGARAELAFNFADTQARFFVQDTDHTLIGFGVTVPFGFRKDMTPTDLQIKGSENVKFALSTMVNSDSGCNCLVPGRAKMAPYGTNLTKTLLNYDRLSIIYLESNKLRLKDAYFNWTVD